jgi:coproporphyrinogen III oxidase
MNVDAVRDWLTGLQESIVARLESLDGGTFAREAWTRPEGGGGVSRLIEGGVVFERAGVNFSDVRGAALPPSASAARPALAGRAWRAMGVSLVAHPRNPYVPTVHLNVRFFVATRDGADDAWWFGGGMDLTPYYGFDEDAIAFHRACRDALAPFGDALYAPWKRACDDYFYLKHRREPRGIGGIFFDDLAEGGFDRCFAIARAVGDAFVAAYAPIVERRRSTRTGAASARSSRTGAAATSSSTSCGTAARCSACKARAHRGDPDVDAAGGIVALRLAPRRRDARGAAVRALPRAARLGGRGGRRVRARRREHATRASRPGARPRRRNARASRRRRCAERRRATIRGSRRASARRAAARARAARARRRCRELVQHRRREHRDVVQQRQRRRHVQPRQQRGRGAEAIHALGPVAHERLVREDRVDRGTGCPGRTRTPRC